MPLIKISKLSLGSLLGLWQMSETIDLLLQLYPSLHDLYLSISAHGSNSRILEKLAVKCLLIEMTGRQDVVVSHNADGCPFVDGYQISISHTKGFAAVILSTTNDVAIDIEYISTRVSKIANRFIREDEQCVNLIQQLIAWCAKETVYKYYSAQHLEFFDMRLHAITSSTSVGKVSVDNLKAQVSVAVNFVVTDDYVLTYIE